VDDVSSTFTGTERRFAIDANHIEMCKYSSKETDGYRKVSRELLYLCHKIEAKAARLKEEGALKQQQIEKKLMEDNVLKELERQ